MSELGKGSKFFIYLPALRVEKKFKEHTTITSATRKGKILVMDDDNLVRSLAGEQIKTLGHEVEYAKDGMDAIEKFILAKDSGKPVDIVILDLTVKSGMGENRPSGTSSDRSKCESDCIKWICEQSSDGGLLFLRIQGTADKTYRLEDLRGILNVLLSE